MEKVHHKNCLFTFTNIKTLWSDGVFLDYLFLIVCLCLKIQRNLCFTLKRKKVVQSHGRAPILFKVFLNKNPCRCRLARESFLFLFRCLYVCVCVRMCVCVCLRVSVCVWTDSFPYLLHLTVWSMSFCSRFKVIWHRHQRQQGLISSTCLRAAFTCSDPKSAKRCLTWLSFCAFGIWVRKSCF